MQPGNKRSTHILYCLPLIFLVLYGALFFYFKITEDRLFDNYITRLQEQYALTVDIYTNMADLSFANTINTAPVLSIIRNSLDADSEEEKNRYRHQLLEQLTPFYAILTQYNFRQLHFHEPDNRSFLRFYKPAVYGDDLTGIRYSVEYVNTYRTEISGFEEGRIFNGYRNVYPLEMEGRALGSVELSISMGAVVEQLEQNFRQKAQFIILASVVAEKVFDGQQDNYIPWDIEESFVLDRNISSDYVLGGFITERTRRLIIRELRESRRSEQPFAFRIRYGKAHKVLAFIPIRNFAEEVVAYIFTVSDDASISGHYRSFLLITLSFGVLMAFFLVFIRYVGKTNRKIEAMIIYDQLTEVYSRRMIFSKLRDELERSRRYGGSFCVAMIDIDFFKKINDRHGHLTGDRVLSELAALLRGNIRRSDDIGRYGGEEFLLILPETTLDSAYAILEKLRRKVAQHTFADGLHLTISGGLAVYHPETTECDALVEEADARLYDAKETGRDKIVR